MLIELTSVCKWFASFFVLVLVNRHSWVQQHSLDLIKRDLCGQLHIQLHQIQQPHGLCVNGGWLYWTERSYLLFTVMQ